MKNTIWYFRVYSLQGKLNLYFIIFHFFIYLFHFPIHSSTSFLLILEMIISGGLSPLSISFSLPLESRSVSVTCSSGTMNLRFTRMNL